MTQPQYGYPPQQGYGQPDPYAQQYPQQPPAPYYQAPAPGQPQSYQMQPAPPVYPGQYGPPPGAPNPGYGVPQQPPVPQGAKGTLDDFYGQPSQGSGKGISWKGKPDGYVYVGVVAKTPVDGDVFQDSDPQTKQLKTWRDGSPKMVLPVQLRLHPMDYAQQQEYPDQDARLFLRGNMRDEVTRAMQEAGATGVPQQGALMIITLTHRKPGNNIATNMYAVQYHPAGTWEQMFSQYTYLLQPPAPQAQQQIQQAPVQYGGAPQQAPYQQQAPAQYAAPAQAYPNTQQYAAPGSMSQGAPQYGGPAYDPNQYGQASANGGAHQQPYAPNPQAPVNQGPAPSQPAAPQPNPQGGYVPQGPAAQVNGQQQLPLPGVSQPQAPQAGPQGQPGVTPSQLDPAQQQLLARISGGQVQAG